MSSNKKRLERLEDKLQINDEITIEIIYIDGSVDSMIDYNEPYLILE